MKKLKVFISSRGEELIDERLLAKEAIGDLKLKPIMFEDWGSGTPPPLEVCLGKVRESDIFLGIYYEEYSEIIEAEYREAKKHDKEILIYEKEPSSRGRAEKLAILLEEFKHLSKGHIVPKFDNVIKLREKIKSDLSLHIPEKIDSDLGLECKIGNITKMTNQADLRFKIKNKMGEALKQTELMISVACNSYKLKYPEEFGDFKYNEDEPNEVTRRGIFKNKSSLIHPELEYPIGKIQVNLEDGVKFLELKLELVAQNIAVEEYFIIIQQVELSNLKAFYSTESESFCPIDLLDRKRYEGLINRLTLGRGSPFF